MQDGECVCTPCFRVLCVCELYVQARMLCLVKRCVCGWLQAVFAWGVCTRVRACV